MVEESCSAWVAHINKVILATDSLVNLFTLQPQQNRLYKQDVSQEKLIESIVRKQLTPAIKAVLTYGIIDPNSSKGATYSIFDPFYLLSSLTCFPSSNAQSSLMEKLGDTLHVWDIIVDYHKRRNINNERTSSAKTLTRSFNLDESNDAPMKLTSKQTLLIAIETIKDKVSKSKPNGPEAHFRAFIYKALNQGKLSIWLRFIFRRSVSNYYYNTSFVSQPKKMDTFFEILDKLSQYEFKLEIDYELTEQFESAF